MESRFWGRCLFFWFSSSVTKSLVRCLGLNDWLNPCDRWWRNATPSHSNVWGRVTALLSINETRFASLTVSHSIKRHQAVETDKNSTPLLNPQTRFHSKCVSASKKSNWRPNRPSRRSLTFCAEPVFKLLDPNLNPRRFTLFPSTTHFITKDHKRRMKGWFDRVSWRKSGRNEEESLPFFFFIPWTQYYFIVLNSWIFLSFALKLKYSVGVRRPWKYLWKRQWVSKEPRCRSENRLFCF